MARDYRRVFAIIKDINASGVELYYKEAVDVFTGGRTKSLGDLSDFELREFINSLQKMTVQKPVTVDTVHDKQRKAIISQFKAIGKTTDDAIAWAEKYGVFGEKKKFNDYNGQELHQLIKNAQKENI